MTNQSLINNRLFDLLYVWNDSNLVVYLNVFWTQFPNFKNQVLQLEYLLFWSSEMTFKIYSNIQLNLRHFQRKVNQTSDWAVYLNVFWTPFPNFKKASFTMGILTFLKFGNDVRNTFKYTTQIESFSSFRWNSAPFPLIIHSVFERDFRPAKKQVLLREN